MICTLHKLAVVLCSTSSTICTCCATDEVTFSSVPSDGRQNDPRFFNGGVPTGHFASNNVSRLCSAFRKSPFISMIVVLTSLFLVGELHSKTACQTSIGARTVRHHFICTVRSTYYRNVYIYSEIWCETLHSTRCRPYFHVLELISLYLHTSPPPRQPLPLCSSPYLRSSLSLPALFSFNQVRAVTPFC